VAPKAPPPAVAEAAAPAAEAEAGGGSFVLLVGVRGLAAMALVPSTATPALRSCRSRSSSTWRWAISSDVRPARPAALRGSMPAAAAACRSSSVARRPPSPFILVHRSGLSRWKRWWQ